MKKCIRVMDKTGDTRHEFDVSDVKARAEAKALFERLKTTGAVIDAKGGGKVTDFDKLGEESVYVPAIVGG